MFEWLLNMSNFSIDYILSHSPKQQRFTKKSLGSAGLRTHDTNGDNFKLENLLKSTKESLVKGETTHYSQLQEKVNQGFIYLQNQKNPQNSSLRNWFFHSPGQQFFHPYYKPQHLRNFKSKKFSQSGRSKRSRTAFTQKQLQVLEESYLKDHYLVGDARRALSGSLHLTEIQVGLFKWFKQPNIKSISLNL